MRVSLQGQNQSPSGFDSGPNQFWRRSYLESENVRQPERPGRLPRGLIEKVVANTRLWPAAPAVLVLILAFMTVPMSGEPVAAELTFRSLAIAAGLVISGGLAIAAGFCSLAPPILWIVGTLVMAASGQLAPWHSGLILLGTAVAAAMTGFQLWRIYTRRFVPTVIDSDDDVVSE